MKDNGRNIIPDILTETDKNLQKRTETDIIGWKQTETADFSKI